MLFICPRDFVMLCFHFYLVSGIFSFISWFLLWPTPHSVINELLNLHEFIHSLEFRLLPILSLLHNFKIRYMQLFQTIIVSQHVIYFRKSSTCCLLECVFILCHLCRVFCSYVRSIWCKISFNSEVSLFLFKWPIIWGKWGVIHLILLVCVIIGLCFWFYWYAFYEIGHIRVWCICI